MAYLTTNKIHSMNDLLPTYTLAMAYLTTNKIHDTKYLLTLCLKFLFTDCSFKKTHELF